MKLLENMDNALSHVVTYVLSRHTEISFHAEGVPDPLYGPWFSETGSPDDEASSTVDALRDTPVIHQEQFRGIDTFFNVRFNSINNRPTFRTYWCNHRLIAVTETIHLGSVVAFAAGCKSSVDESSYYITFKTRDDRVPTYGYWSKFPIIRGPTFGFPL